jgi:hypothetical protein
MLLVAWSAPRQKRTAAAEQFSQFEEFGGLPRAPRPSIFRPDRNSPPNFSRL